jgi:hypothetical protein
VASLDENQKLDELLEYQKLNILMEAFITEKGLEEEFLIYSREVIKGFLESRGSILK